MLACELKKGGVYAIVLFDQLTDLEADEHEYLLIRKIKQNKLQIFTLLIVEPELAGNVQDGNVTSRIKGLFLKPNEMNQEMDQIYEKTMQAIGDRR
jgi:hypothetical protein